ncbi:MAG: prepilin-type N-terminal cleavage/methylation domain-containing protein [Thiomargarita sp.]|nr:prepilin-type N-terminal cleavage/methylation domain-containing protein [Thiomargarita sp.]
MKNLNGFSLLELLIVLLIIGMAAAVVIPKISGGQVTLLNAQAREAMAALKYARRLAIVEGKEQSVTFYEGKNTSDKKSAKSGQWVSRGASVQWGGELQENDKMVHKITFFPEGGSSGGKLILKHFEHQVQININPLTGRIKLEADD